MNTQKFIKLADICKYPKVYSLCLSKIQDRGLQFPVRIEIPVNFTKSYLEIAESFLKNIYSKNLNTNSTDKFLKVLNKYERFTNEFYNNPDFTGYCEYMFSGAKELSTILYDIIENCIAIEPEKPRTITKRVDINTIDTEVYLAVEKSGKKFTCYDIDNYKDWTDIVNDQRKLSYAYRTKNYIRGRKISGKWTFRSIKQLYSINK